MNVDLGCGAKKLEGYVGVDLVEQEGVDIVCDVEKDGLPFDPASVETLHTSHFLEHVSKERVPFVLMDCYRVLKPLGNIVVIVPDLTWVLDTFQKIPEEEKWGFPIDTIFGCQLHPGEFHKTGFTKARLRKLLEEAGFQVHVCMPVWNHSQQSLLARGRK